MNKEQIIELAKQACDKYKADAWHNGFWTITQEELERFAQLIRNQTLEDAALIVESLQAENEKLKYVFGVSSQVIELEKKLAQAQAEIGRLTQSKESK